MIDTLHVAHLRMRRDKLSEKLVTLQHSNAPRNNVVDELLDIAEELMRLNG